MVIRDAHIVIKLYKNLRNGSGKVRVAVYFDGRKRVKIGKEQMELLLG